MSIVLEWLGILGGTAAIIAAIVAAAGWLARTLLLHRFSRELESHKAALKEASDRELERVRGELRRTAFEFEARYSRLHEEVFKAIVETYPALQDLHQSVISYLSVAEWSGEPSKDEKLKIVAEKSRRFNEIYIRKRILFPKHLYRQLDDFVHLLVRESDNFAFGLRRERSHPDLLPEGHDPWGKAMKVVGEQIRPLFDAMHDELQTVLGFSDYPGWGKGMDPPPRMPSRE